MPALRDDTLALPEVRAPLLGGRLCLDFANTADYHASEHPIELVPSYPHVVSWALRAGGLGAGDASRLLALAAASPDRSAAAHARAIALREALYRTIAGHSRGGAASSADLALLNRELQRAFAALAVVPAVDGSYGWRWSAPLGPDSLDAPLWPVAHDAAALLASAELARVRECAGHGCGWLFLDTSRNHSRRWCSMEACGNRAKARRHYQRERAVRGAGAQE